MSDNDPQRTSFGLPLLECARMSGLLRPCESAIGSCPSHIREHKVQIGRARHEGLGRFVPLVNGTLLGVLELGTSL